MSSTITPTEFAATVGSDGKTVRKFLRSVTPREEQPGKGARWALPATKRDLASLTKKYNEWSAKQEADRATRAQAKADEANQKVEEVVEEEDEELDA